MPVALVSAPEEMALGFHFGCIRTWGDGSRFIRSGNTWQYKDQVRGVFGADLNCYQKFVCPATTTSSPSRVNLLMGLTAINHRYENEVP